MSGATCIGQWHPSVRMPPRLSAGRSHTGCSAHNGISCSEGCDSFPRPAAVLVCAFEINVGWPGQIRLMAEHGNVAGAGFEPDVDNIGLLTEFRSPTLTALGARGERLGFGRVPGIGAEAPEELNHFAIERRVIQRLAATF